MAKGSVIQFRLDDDTKTGWQSKADAAGLSLSAWIIRCGNAGAEVIELPGPVGAVASLADCDHSACEDRERKLKARVASLEADVSRLSAVKPASVIVADALHKAVTRASPLAVKPLTSAHWPTCDCAACQPGKDAAAKPVKPRGREPKDAEVSPDD